MTDGRIPVAILGAGPAGLGAALCLARRPQFAVTLFERNSIVGGNAGSFDLEGLRVDYGSHRLHPTCSSRVLSDIRSLVGDELNLPELPYATSGVLLTVTLKPGIAPGMLRKTLRLMHNFDDVDPIELPISATIVADDDR